MSDESLFREVDEEVRRERLAKLWARYGNLVLVVSIAVILGVAGTKGWQYWKRHQAEAAGASYFSALALQAEGKAEEAGKALTDVITGGHAGYSTLARLQAAAKLSGEGKTEEAVKAYDAIAADLNAPAEFRDLARIRACYLLAGTASLEDLQSRLQPLDTPGNPWLNSVREIKATAAYRAGDYQLADRLMNEVIADPNAPQGARQRALIMVQLLTPLLKPRAEAANQPAGQ